MTGLSAEYSGDLGYWVRLAMWTPYLLEEDDVRPELAAGGREVVRLPLGAAPAVRVQAGENDVQVGAHSSPG
jgi:hypothetical protein